MAEVQPGARDRRGSRVGSVRDWWWGDQNIAPEATALGDQVGAISLQVKGLGAWRP